MTGVILGLIGIAVALAVPLFVEWSRRPKLVIDRTDDVNQRGTEPAWRIVHIKVANLPLQGPLGRYLLRNAAASCRVTITFRSLSNGDEIRMPGRWSASPEPRSLVGLPPEVPMEYYNLDPARAGRPGIEWPFDLTKVPQTLRTDLAPDLDGEPVPVAIKYAGDTAAFGFTSESYAYEDFRKPDLRLADEEYLVTVDVAAGGIGGSRRFRLRNAGGHETDLRLEPLE